MVNKSKSSQLLNKRLVSCLDIANCNYGNLLNIPNKSDILVNVEQMKDKTLAHTTFNNNFRHVKNIISLNEKYVLSHLDTYADEIIPHEVAHAICFHNGSIDNGHGGTWKELCYTMGGSGEQFVKL